MKSLTAGIGGAAALAACGLAACGSSAASSGAAAYARQPAARILRDVEAALAAAHSFSASGSVPAQGTTATASFAVADPSGVSATLQRGPALVKLTTVPGHSYIYANAAFWTQQSPQLGATQVAALANRWYVVPATADTTFSSIVNQVSAAQLSRCVVAQAASPRVIGTGTVAGQRAVKVRFSGTRPGTAPGVMWISLSAPHFPLRLQKTGPGVAGGSGACRQSAADARGPEDLRLSGWNHTTVSAPAHASRLP
ncbi:MAG TPA: hypothetical protein VFN48_05580 [Solirubrobacteraceae bacterium]|nr:hypothetical protein [Solirubrobacteraceae bacterium]